jgi:predicted hydrocarbon binding protein
MHGFIFNELRDYVIARLGTDAWPSLLDKAHVGPKTYFGYRDYPDEEVVALVVTASEVTGLAAATILEDFGAFLAPHLFKIYRPLIDPTWRTLEFIENTESTIHHVVRSRNSTARPPALRCRRVAPQTLVVTYGSPRKLCAVARGIIRGLAQHFGETVEIVENDCMLAGRPSCQIQVQRV